MHLRMTGRVHVVDRAPSPHPHLRAVFQLGEDRFMTLRDQRRFATLRLVGTPELNGDWSAHLGVEPLGPGFTASRLATLLAGRRAPVKAALLDQRLVAGIGNIYADEALFQARIHPRRPAGSLTDAEVRSLHRAVRDRLRIGIASNGASIDSFHDSLGQPGTMQEQLRVHLRQGEPCRRCKAPVAKTRVAQRGTYVCERCQR